MIYNANSFFMSFDCLIYDVVMKRKTWLHTIKMYSIFRYVNSRSRAIEIVNKGNMEVTNPSAVGDDLLQNYSLCKLI